MGGHALSQDRQEFGAHEHVATGRMPLRTAESLSTLLLSLLPLRSLHGRPDCRSRAARENRVIKQSFIECVLLRYVRRDYVSMTIFTAER